MNGCVHLECKGEVQAKDKNWGITIPSMSVHALLSGSVEGIHSIRWKDSAFIYPSEMEVGHGDLKAENAEQPSPCDPFFWGIPNTWSILQSCQMPSRKPWALETSGKLRLLSSPWGLHPTATILPFPSTNNFVPATLFFKTKPKYNWGCIHRH